jgi:hypothetical protein
LPAPRIYAFAIEQFEPRVIVAFGKPQEEALYLDVNTIQ